jgi:hypothetical protein
VNRLFLWPSAIRAIRAIRGAKIFQEKAGQIFSRKITTIPHAAPEASLQRKKQESVSRRNTAQMGAVTNQSLTARLKNSRETLK